MEDFYSTGWNGIVPDEQFILGDDYSRSWETEAESDGLWIKSPCYISPHKLTVVADALRISVEDVVAILEGYALWTGDVIYLEPVPGVRLNSHVSQWRHQRQMWAIVVAHDESAEESIRAAAAEILENADWSDPAGIREFTADIEHATGPLVILEALNELGVSDCELEAYFVTPLSKRAPLPRVGGMTVDHPDTRAFRNLERYARYGKPEGFQRLVFEMFESQGFRIPRHTFWEIPDHHWETDEDEDTEEFYFGDEPHIDSWWRDPTRSPVGVAIVGEHYAIDFPFVTFLTTRDGAVVSQWPSFGATLVAACDERVLTYTGPGWSFVQYDLETQTWLRELRQKPSFDVSEGMERSYLTTRETGRTVRMETLPDYPVFFSLSPCGTYVGAVTKEFLGGVYRDDGQEQFTIDQPSFYERTKINLRTGQIKEVPVWSDSPSMSPEEKLLASVFGESSQGEYDEARNAYEEYDEEEDEDFEYGTYNFALVLVDGETPHWQMATSEGYAVGLEPLTVFRPLASAVGFSKDGRELLAIGSNVALLECSPEGVALLRAGEWNDLSALGPDLDGEEDIVMQIVLSTFGTLDQIPSVNKLKALVVPVDYETNRNLSHKEATEIWEIAKDAKPIKILFR